jgi:hypothetical protein
MRLRILAAILAGTAEAKIVGNELKIDGEYFQLESIEEMRRVLRESDNNENKIIGLQELFRLEFDIYNKYATE